jgi:hypothetical protein
MNIPEGDYTMGVKAISGGVDFQFKDLFVISVVTKWDETPVLTETFDYAPDAGTPLEEPFASYPVNGSVEKYFTAVHLVKDSPHRDVHSARLLYGKDGMYDITIVLMLTNDGTWRNLRISFGQFFGYGAAAVNLFERTLWYSYTNEPEGGTFTPDNWMQIMGPDDQDWLSENLWQTEDPINDGDFPQTPYKEFSGLDPAQSNIYVCWRYFTEGSTTTGAQWLLDDINVQAAKAYEAEEE